MAGNDDENSKPAAGGELDVAIVGAGFSGLYMLHRVRDVLKLKTRVFEAADGVGGTWYWNRYPGARCDSESYFYCYSFSEELEQDWTWTSKFPEQPEILSYLNHVADRFDLRRDIQLNTRITNARFEDSGNRWLLSTDTGETVAARFLISAVGCLSARNLPDIPGVENFAGEKYHTGNWPHEGVDFRAKRVGLIGTGSTGIQAAPVIAEEAEHLYVFQRTPNFSVPARNTVLTAEETARIKANYDDIRRISRTSAFGFPFETPEHAAMEVTPDERHATYEQRWKEGGISFGFKSFNDILVDKAANDSASDFIREKIRETVKDPEVAELLIPTDHPYGAKRPPLDTNYFETYNRDNVTLVDVRAAPIEEITERGVRTERNEYDLDVIVFATGFDAMTGALLAMNVEGSGGLRLADKWADGPVTYLGLQVAGFPNLFTITGPGSPSVLANMPIAIEQHVEWVSDCLEHLYANGISRIEATQAAEQDWVRHVAEEGDATLFPLANSWYVGANIPGKTRVFMPYVGGMGKYREHCDHSAQHGYDGFVLSA
jgi:cation diffusion facilitator CzcD-associated flavoprotein CzcO